MVTSMETPGQCIRMVTMLVSPLILQDLLGRLPELLHGDLLHVHPLPAEHSTESRNLSYSRVTWSMSFPSQLIPARGLPAFLHPQHLRSPPHHPIIPALGRCRCLQLSSATTTQHRVRYKYRTKTGSFCLHPGILSLPPLLSVYGPKFPWP